MSFISLCMLGLLKHLKCSSEKLTILSYGTLELNERYGGKIIELKLFLEYKFHIRIQCKFYSSK